MGKRFNNIGHTKISGGGQYIWEYERFSEQGIVVVLVH
jgi:hypothetical protein